MQDPQIDVECCQQINEPRMSCEVADAMNQNTKEQTTRADTLAELYHVRMK